MHADDRFKFERYRMLETCNQRNLKLEAKFRELEIVKESEIRREPGVLRDSKI